MDANHCADADTLDLYVLNRLGEADSASLEEHILLCSECLRQVEETLEFVAVLKVASALVSAKSPNHDRRLETRVKVNRRVELCDHAGERTCCQTVDYSLHGLGVFSPLRFPPGVHLKVVIDGIEKHAHVKFCAPIHVDTSQYRVGLSCG